MIPEIKACWTTTGDGRSRVHSGPARPAGRLVLCVWWGGAECAFFLFFFFGRGAEGSAVQIQPRRRGKWGGMIEGSEGNVFIMTSPSLLSVNPLRGSSLH